MKKIFVLFIILSFYSIISSAQDATGIFIFDFQISDENIDLSNFRDIPLPPGYNNQPAFISNTEILFSSENNGNPDIRKYNLETGNLTWMHSETPGGEYSPQLIPDSEDIAAVRLDPDGLQRLYRYGPGKKPSVLIENIAVAYFAFFDSNRILATILNEDKMDLVTIDLNLQKVDTLASDAGRTLEKIPGTELMTYSLVNESGQLDIYTYNMETGESVFICELPYTILDYIWLDDSRILAGANYRLFLFDTWDEGDWSLFGSAEKYGITEITRMALSPGGKKLAIVGKKKP